MALDGDSQDRSCLPQAIGARRGRRNEGPAREAEVFLNLDPVDRMGEFSWKDPDYGDAVMTELGKVLLPVRSRH
jgi:hypothetical protein